MTPVWPVEANEVFALIARATCDNLKAKGAAFYERLPDNLPTSAAVKAVREAVSKLADLPEGVRQQATAAADRVRAELNRTNQQTLEAARSQRDTIEAAFHDLHERLDTFGEKADTELQKAALSLLLAERELELKTELALVRYAASHVDDAVALNKGREEMSEQFALAERRHTE